MQKFEKEPSVIKPSQDWVEMGTKEEAELIEGQSELAERVRKLRSVERTNKLEPFHVHTRTAEADSFNVGEQLRYVFHRTEMRADELEWRDRNPDKLHLLTPSPERLKDSQEAIEVQEKFMQERKQAARKGKILNVKNLDSITFDFLRNRFGELMPKLETEIQNLYYRLPEEKERYVRAMCQSVEKIIKEISSGNKIIPSEAKEYPGAFLMDQIRKIESILQKSVF